MAAEQWQAPRRRRPASIRLLGGGSAGNRSGPGSSSGITGSAAVDRPATTETASASLARTRQSGIVTRQGVETTTGQDLLANALDKLYGG